MSKVVFSILLLVAIGGCAHAPDRSRDTVSLQAAVSIAPFSVNHASGGLPSQWLPLVIHRTKKPTQYKLVSEQGETILHASASGSSSGLMQHVDIDPLKQPWLVWQWKIASLISTANNHEHHAEDSPVRIILGFDGDKDNLPFADQLLFETVRAVTGHDFPYATLMYIWENKADVGTIIASGRSGRIKMLVAESGPEGVGKWRDFTRNIAEDFEQAFGEKPGKLIGVGVLTDTDNTGETVEAWYRDIRLQRQHQIAARGK